MLKSEKNLKAEMNLKAKIHLKCRISVKCKCASASSLFNATHKKLVTAYPR